MHSLSSVELTMLVMHLPQTGGAAFCRLLERFKTVEHALQASAEDLIGCLKPEAIDALQAVRLDASHALVRKVRQDVNWLQERNIRLLDCNNELYPSLLREVHRAPPLLYIWGDPALLSLPQVAVVGSRKPTSGGRTNAIEFARGLAETGFTITSGLALGVDIAAHQGALQAGGKTLAILGTGIDQIYPARHLGLAEQIVATGGAVVSEFPLGTAAHPSNFPQRNRIISGLSCGVLVVEAAIKSGSLITARYALSQNRDVFAIPGSIQNPLAKGCHALIKEGAKLVEAPDDIVEELQNMLAYQRGELQQAKAPSAASASTQGTIDAFAGRAQQAPEPVAGNERLILECLGYDAMPFDSIAESTGIAAGDLMATLLTLELKGVLQNLGHGYARVRS